MNCTWTRWLLLATVLFPAAFLVQAGERSPFEAVGASAGPVTGSGDADLEGLELSGISSIRDVRSFNFTDARTRRSFWVPFQGSENGFTVVSYDESSQQVMVRRGSATRPISLRKSVLVAVAPPPGVRSTPAPVPPPTVASSAPAGKGVDEIKDPKTPPEIKQAEFEARMLVSDLLDISMKERARQKVLRDAQARGQAAPATR